MKNAKLYILCGLPYSGKSTFASEIVKRKNCEHVSVDQIINEMGWEGIKLTESQWREIYQIAHHKIEKLLIDGRSVVYDGASQTKKQLEDLTNLALKLRKEFQIIYIKVPDTEIYNRQYLNLGTNSHLAVGRDQIDYVIHHFEEPDLTEAIIYDESMPVDDFIKEKVF